MLISIKAPETPRMQQLEWLSTSSTLHVIVIQSGKVSVGELTRTSYNQNGGSGVVSTHDLTSTARQIVRGLWGPQSI